MDFIGIGNLYFILPIGDFIMLATLDKFGRILIPKQFREHLGISNDTKMNIEADGERIIIEVVKNQEPLVEKDGLLIFTGKLQGDVDRALKSNRSQRMDNVLTGK